MCHGQDMNGGVPIEEGAPPGPSIAVYGSAWSSDDFLKTIRTGVTPYGKELNPEYMPWKYYGKMTDDELLAIHRYLESVISH